MSLNLSCIITASARRFPGEPAILFGEERLTYADLARAVNRTANALLGLGLAPGDRVALMVPNRPEFTVAYFGILQAGMVVVPLNTLFVAPEVAYHLEDSGAALLIAWEEYEEVARAALERVESCPPLVLVGPREDARPAGALSFAAWTGQASDAADVAQTMPDDTAVILYTSGTTGRPKGAELTHFSLYSNAQWSSERSQSVLPDRVVIFGPGNLALSALPLFHCFGQTCVQNSMLFNGGAFTCLPRWSPGEALRIMERDGVTHFSGVPTMYFALLHAPEASGVRLERLRFCNSGGAPMPVEVMAEFEAKFPARILEGYGLTETSPVATFHTPEFPRRPGSVGKAIGGCEVGVVDDEDRPLPPEGVGEVVIRGQNIMKGYYRRPAATAEAMRNGWFHSGDIGKLDEEGYLHILDRKKDMILRGGFNVYPRELEEVIYAHPAIREAAVVGIPDREHGEEVVAVVALKEDVVLTAGELIAYCRERMAAYKYPRHVEFRDSLPKGGTGKILKRELRAELAQAVRPPGRAADT
jgi:long-chain acyl-CoA synthetase